MKKHYEVYLFRHGKTTYNEKEEFTGWRNPPLTKQGREDAAIIAERLKNKKFGIAIQTRLKRSKDTLKVVLRGHKECKERITDDRMIERNYGALNQETHLKIVRQYGIKHYDNWHRGFDVRPPKGESFADVEKRVRPFIRDLKKLIKKEKTNIAISAHGNSIRLFRKIMKKASKKEAVDWTIPYDNYETYLIKV